MKNWSSMIVPTVLVCAVFLLIKLPSGDNDERQRHKRAADEAFTELQRSVEPQLVAQIKAGSGISDVRCVIDRGLFTAIVPARTYRMAVYCRAGETTYSTLIEVTRFGKNEMYWDSNGLMASSAQKLTEK